MNMLVVFLLIALSVLAVAAVCNALLSPKVRTGETTHGRASAITLFALLVTPALATTLILAAFEVPAMPLMVYFYAGFAVGLVCFIVLNRRYRDMGRS